MSSGKLKAEKAKNSWYSLRNLLRLVSNSEKCSSNAERLVPGSNAYRWQTAQCRQLKCNYDFDESSCHKTSLCKKENKIFFSKG